MRWVAAHIGMIVFFVLWTLVAAYILLWVFSFRTFPVNWGVSFSQGHAKSLGLDWQKAFIATLDELGPTHLRIGVPWTEVEKTKGQFEYADIDWMMDEADKRGVKMTMVVGQKIPRWPECYLPDWYSPDASDAKEKLLQYVRTTVERYKHHPALELWQVENEPFIRFGFGECERFRTAYVYDEIDLVRSLDPSRQIMTTDSGEMSTWWQVAQAGDILGSTIYRIVRMPTGHIFSYNWLPAGLYRFKSALLGKRDSFYISELQGEPWFHTGDAMSASIEEQEQTMTPDRLKKHMEYSTRVGASRVYLWGVEWWYYMKEVRGDARYWEVVKTSLNRLKIISK